ncbi:MAG: SPOR domain-containing protein [Chitinophagaceae bacterium]|nr:MAG: SPOR domain-containing protein [Chitinophagaceae bacterium]
MPEHFAIQTTIPRFCRWRGFCTKANRNTNDGLKRKVTSARGYRLMVLSSNDRNLAMKLRSSLLQMYPQHKVYMVYQNPFIKLKMGNFVEKAEAENFKKQLIRQGVIPGNIYLLSEMVEIKPDLEDAGD